MKKGMRVLLKIVAIPVGYALLLRFMFGIESWHELYSVMSVSFLFCLPTIVGFLTVFFASERMVRKKSSRFMLPWIPIAAFSFITLLFEIEGWACWLMVLPLFLVAASIGGLIGGYFKFRKARNNRVYVSAFVLLPVLASPLESMFENHPVTYKAYTCIDIQSSSEKIWENVTRVRAIPVEDDTGWLTGFLGFPRPVNAELNYEGVGAYRRAVFTGGLVFHETVLEYEHRKRMFFTIKAFPHEIPSTTMDEHVVIGGEYFDVLNGTYELEDKGDGWYRLHLYSHFQLNTNFNFYAGVWATWIMEDIQDNILKVVRKRAEDENYANNWWS